MQWLIGSIGSFFIMFFTWLAKKIGASAVITVLYISFLTLASVTFVTAIYFIISYINYVWTVFKDLVPHFFDYSGVTGSYGGLENQTIVSSFLALLNESGLASALINSMNLLVGLISLHLSIRFFLIFLYVARSIKNIITGFAIVIK